MYILCVSHACLKFPFYLLKTDLSINFLDFRLFVIKYRSVFAPLSYSLLSVKFIFQDDYTFSLFYLGRLLKEFYGHLAYSY